MRSADIVIVGAGVIGASIAYHLAIRGCKSILVLERNAEPGAGSTLKATGGFRAQFGSDINVRLSLLSREKLIRFPDELGVDSGYRPFGYLFLATGDAHLSVLREAQAIQHAAGLIEARMIGIGEIAQINPAIKLHGIAGGAFCETDGFIRAGNILRGYIDTAAKLGAKFEYNVRVTDLHLVRDRITDIRSPAGDISANIVVNAAGPWAANLARLAGVDLPVTPLRRQAAITEPTNLLNENMPMTIWLNDGFHCRVRDERVLLLFPDYPNLADPFDTSFSEDWLTHVLSLAKDRIPVASSIPIDRSRCWAGLYEMSPDKHAILGKAPGLANLFLANGSSGHGVMHAPALGQLMAEIIVDGKTSSLNVDSLRPSRFQEQKLNPAPVLL